MSDDRPEGDLKKDLETMAKLMSHKAQQAYNFALMNQAIKYMDVWDDMQGDPVEEKSESGSAEIDGKKVEWELGEDGEPISLRVDGMWVVLPVMETIARFGPDWRFLYEIDGRRLDPAGADLGQGRTDQRLTPRTRALPGSGRFREGATRKGQHERDNHKDSARKGYRRDQAGTGRGARSRAGRR